MLKHQEGLWTFVDHEGVDPTNNVSERMLRPAVIWRKVSFGTRSERGNRFVERILTVLGTCRLQGRNALSYLTEAVRCHQRGQPAPSLLPADLVPTLTD